MNHFELAKGAGMIISVLALGANIVLFDALSMGKYGFLMPLSEGVASAFLAWAVLVSAALLGSNMTLAGIVIITAAWMYLDRATLAIAYITP